MWSSLKKALVPAVFGAALMTVPANAAPIPLILDPTVNTLFSTTQYEYNPAGYGSGTLDLLFYFEVSPDSVGTKTTATVLNPNGGDDLGIKDLKIAWLDASKKLIKSETFTSSTGLLDNSALLSLTVYSVFEPYYLSVVGTVLDAGGYLDLFLTTGAAGGPPEVPLPPALILFGSALLGLTLLVRRRRSRGLGLVAG